GDLSHEFLILAETGESRVFCHRRLLDFRLPDKSPTDAKDLQALVDQWTSVYAASDDKHDPAKGNALGADLITARGIEVGHIFYFGTKYSKSMKALVAGPKGEEVTVEMGSYGIGVSRLAGAIIEASHDDAGIIWPESVAPFRVGLINLKSGDSECDAACEDIYRALARQGTATLYDDRDQRAGVKFADMDLIGLPWQIVVGPRGVKSGVIEIKNRHSGERQESSRESALARLAGG
ncbi:MAG: His/Gly/Thr/Pro-type tRNA ligase C-terminal domain-containing protein, partial [Pseudomonadota bacterium]